MALSIYAVGVRTICLNYWEILTQRFVAFCEISITKKKKIGSLICTKLPFFLDLDEWSNTEKRKNKYKIPAIQTLRNANASTMIETFGILCLHLVVWSLVSACVFQCFVWTRVIVLAFFQCFCGTLCFRLRFSVIVWTLLLALGFLNVLCGPVCLCLCLRFSSVCVDSCACARACVSRVYRLLFLGLPLSASMFVLVLVFVLAFVLVSLLTLPAVLISVAKGPCRTSCMLDFANRFHETARHWWFFFCCSISRWKGWRS